MNLVVDTFGNFVSGRSKAVAYDKQIYVAGSKLPSEISGLGGHGAAELASNCAAPASAPADEAFGSDPAAVARVNELFTSSHSCPEVIKVVIVRAPDRGQLRGQITGTKTIRTFAYPSKKNREARYGEGATEIERIKAEEVETNIVRAIAQPCRIQALLEGCGHWTTHIPDFSNLRANGDRFLIDAKRNWSDFRKPDGRRQTFLGELAAEALGYRYERVVLSSMGDSVRRANVDDVQASRFVHVPDHLVARAAAAVANGPISLGNLANLLHPVNGRSMVYALMVRRIVEIDLEARLSPRSECVSVKQLPIAMPSLRG